MTVRTASVFKCDMCTYTEIGLEGAYDVPLGWLTIRVTKMTDAGGAHDKHICESCGYTDLRDIWEVI